MSESKKALEAKDFIQSHTGRELDNGNINKNNIKFTGTRSEHVSHTDTANALIKIINVTPGLSPISRRVMSMRIINPGISVMSVALQLGLRELDVVKYEADGKDRVKAYIDRASLQDHTDKFNSNETVNRAVENELRSLNKTAQNPLMA